MRTLRSSLITFALSLMLASGAARADGVVHQVSVGGPDQDQAAHTDANFSLVAIQYGDGRVAGQWTDQFGQGQGGVHVVIDCLEVQGNEAWLGGIISQGNVGGVDVTGARVITRVRDNGASGGNTPDEISFTFFNNPNLCTAKPPLPLLPMTAGQVKVR